MFSKIAIAGGPNTGKTTLGKLLAEQLNLPLISTDDYIKQHGWNGLAKRMAEVGNGLDEFIIEGIRVPWALREGLIVDYTIWLSRPHIKQTPKQRSLAKGCRTVYIEWLERLS